MTRSTRLLAFTVMLVCGMRTAHAQDGYDANQTPIKDRADAAFHQGDMRTALALYRESYAKTHDARVLYNAGRAASALGDHAAAYGYFRQFSESANDETLAKVPMIVALTQNELAQSTWLDLRANLDGAVVLVRGEKVGGTPLARVLVNAGDARIDVLRDDCLPFSRTLSLPAGGTILIDANLHVRASAGTLRIVTSPPGARIEVDGEDLGMTPTEAVLNQGSHRVVATKDGFEPKTLSTVVAAGASSSVSLDLQQKGAVYTRWWFWAGAAVVLAGGVGVTYALTRPRDPETGTLGPGRLGTLLHF